MGQLADLYEIVSCDIHGATITTHPDAHKEDDAHQELNGAASFKFSVPVSDPGLASLSPNTREVQLWRQGMNVPCFWGRITNKDYDPDSHRFHITCASLFSYLDHRYVGKQGRTNLLANPSFDTGSLAPWSGNVVANVVTQWGGRPGATFQANLYNTGPALGDGYIHQEIIVPGGTVYTISAWFHIRTDATWVGPAVDGRGLWVERHHPTTNVLEDQASFVITDYTLRGQFQRASLTMWTPPGRTSLLDIRLYCPSVTNATPVAPRPPGSIIWDDAYVVAPESLPFLDADVANIVNGLVTHAQDFTFLKTDLNLTPGGTPTGLFMDRVYQHCDHRQISDALNEFSQLGFCDLDIIFEPGTLRRIVTCFTPQEGTVRTDIAFELDADQGMRMLASIEGDGTKTVTTAIVKGDGSGPDTDEGGWWDASQVGNIVYEEIYQAQPGTHHDLLDGLAKAYVNQLNHPTKVPQFTVGGQWVGAVHMGDTVRVIVPTLGVDSIDANYRIVGWDIDPELDTLQLTVNPA